MVEMDPVAMPYITATYANVGDSDQNVMRIIKWWDRSVFKANFTGTEKNTRSICLELLIS